MIIGIGGCSCSGKTTLSKKLKEKLLEEGFDVEVVNQDNYYKSMDLEYWENPDSIKMDEFRDEIIKKNEEPSKTARLNQKIIIAEGFLVYCLERPFFDLAFFVTAPYEVIKARREKRDDWMEWKDPEGYFEKEVYPAYIRNNAHVINSKNKEYIKVDGTEGPEIMVTKVMKEIYSNLP